MINNIKEFINIIKNKNFDIKLINLIYNNEDEDEKIFNIKDSLWITEDYQPTILANNKTINFIMELNQSYTYLNDYCLNIIKEFEKSFNCYLNIYNKIQTYEKVYNPNIFIKINYDIKTKNYSISTTFYKNIFYTHENSLEPKNMFTQKMRSVMRSNPALIMVGEMCLTSTLLVDNNNYNNYNNTRVIPDNYNIIYSSNGVELNHMFTTVNGLYREHELFNAIQSYIDITENDNCNILEPNFINSSHFNDLMNLSKMIRI